MSTMTPEAAVMHPSRARIMEILAESPAGATAFDIAERMNLHHNAVRTHLSVLARAGLVWSEREKATGRPGRPRIIFRVSDPIAGADEASRREMVEMLLRLVTRARVSPVEVEAVGVEEGRLLAERGGSLVDTLQRTGFAPDDVTDADQAARGERHLVLRHCPFADAVAGEHGAMVCALHLGIAKGLVAAQGGEVIDFKPVNPRAPACRVVARFPEAPEADDEGSGAAGSRTRRTGDKA